VGDTTERKNENGTMSKAQMARGSAGDGNESEKASSNGMSI
jgi:hypothetical protein